MPRYYPLLLLRQTMPKSSTTTTRRILSIIERSRINSRKRVTIIIVINSVYRNLICLICLQVFSLGFKLFSVTNDSINILNTMHNTK